MQPNCKQKPRSGNLVDVLNALVPQVSVDYYGRQKIPGAVYRDLWVNGSINYPPGSIERPPGFGRLVSALRECFGSLVRTDRNGKDCVLSRITFMLDGSGTPSTELDRIAVQVLLSALLISPEKTAVLLLGWLDGQPLRRTHITVYSGFRMEEGSRLDIAPGVSMRQLPRTGEELNKLRVPSFLEPASGSLHHGLDVSGAPALFADMDCHPVFGPLDPAKHANPLRYEAEHAFKDGFWLPTEAMSLAFDSPVQDTYSWSSGSMELQSFSPGSRSSYSTRMPLLETRGQPPIVTPEMMSHAADIGQRMLLHPPGDKLNMAMSRWTKSKLAHGADQFIELRIAFEALYAGTEQGESTFRVKTRCARHLADSLEDRKSLSKQIGDFYSHASRFVHGKSWPRKSSEAKKLSERVAEAQGVCRTALLRIIERNACNDLDLETLSLE